MTSWLALKITLGLAWVAEHCGGSGSDGGGELTEHHGRRRA